MSANLYWFQCGGCGGDTMSFLGNESPDVLQLLGGLGIDLLHHPSLSNSSVSEQAAQLNALMAGEVPLDVLVVEGAVLRGPAGTGMYDTKGRRPKKDIVAALARRARFVVAAGTCASFGGFGARTEIEATGLQFRRTEHGGFLGADFRSLAGLPVINLSGCPCHGEVLGGALSALVQRCRPGARRIPAPAVLVRDDGASGLHPQRVPRIPRRGGGVRPEGLPVLPHGLPWPAGGRALQQDPVEPAVVEDPGGGSLFRLHQPRVSAVLSVFRNPQYRGHPDRAAQRHQTGPLHGVQGHGRGGRPQRLRKRSTETEGDGR